MERRAALIAAAAVAALASAALTSATALAKKKAAATKQPLAIHLRGIDLAHRLILIEVDGLAKAPLSNYFTMTDDRGHHYIAQTIHCAPPSPSGTRACELEIPGGYERHPLAALELHRGGLHGRPILVDAAEVKAAWLAAQEAHARSSDESSAEGSTADGGVLDSGVAPADAAR